MEITESQFEGRVKELAHLLGYMYYHTWRSMHSVKGFPDCVMVRLEPTPKLIFAELKVGKSQPTFEQYAWLYLVQELSRLTNGIVDAYLWYPDDHDEMVEVLR